MAKGTGGLGVGEGEKRGGGGGRLGGSGWGTRVVEEESATEGSETEVALGSICCFSLFIEEPTVFSFAGVLVEGLSAFLGGKSDFDVFFAGKSVFGGGGSSRQLRETWPNSLQ